MNDYLKNIISFLFPPLPVSVNAKITLNLAEDNTLQPQLSFTHKGKSIPFPPINSLLIYGTTWKHKRKKFHMASNSLAIIKAIQEADTAGSFKQDVDNGIPFNPAFIRYLRKQPGVKMQSGDMSNNFDVMPLRPAAEINFKPGHGLTVRSGYSRENINEFIYDNDITICSNNFARIGKVFAELPEQKENLLHSFTNGMETFVPPDKIPDFITNVMDKLPPETNIFSNQDYNRIKIITSAQEPVFDVSVREPGWIDFNISINSGTQQIPYNSIDHKTEESFVQLDQFTWLKKNQKLIDNIDKLLKKTGARKINETFRVPFSNQYRLNGTVELINGTIKSSENYSDFISTLQSFKAESTFKLNDEIERDLTEAAVILRPYQRAGIHWITWLAKNNLHGILADDMGLGKTLQTILAIRVSNPRNPSRKHICIVCPKSVVHFWAREFHRFYKTIPIALYLGPNRSPDWFRNKEQRVFISTYETFANDAADLSHIKLGWLILDEATKIKNPTARRSILLKNLQAEHRLALTGTPVENRPVELWSIFDFLMPGYLGTVGQFEIMYEEHIMQGNKRKTDNLGKRISPFLLRRRKEEVAKDLPEKIFMTEQCELSPEQKRLYIQIQNRTITPLLRQLKSGVRVNYAQSILPLLTMLKQLCDHPSMVTGEATPLSGRSEKFDWVLQRIEVAHSYSEKCVVFTYFMGALDLLGKALDERNLKWIRIDGQTKNRQELIDFFNNGDTDVALCSLMASGYGINLTSASHVIHFDRWWNPAVENQATDRVHRIGQDKTVYVHKATIRNTIEERIETLLERKQKMSNSIMGAADAKKLQWDKEELIELLRPI